MSENLTSEISTKIVYSNKLEREEQRDIEAFCDKAFEEKKQPNHVNMEVDEWWKKPHTLMFKLLAEQLFHEQNGGLVLLYAQQELIGLSGVYALKQTPFFIGGARTWIKKEFRWNYYVVNEMLPLQYRIAEKLHGKFFLLTFNEEMKAFADLIERCNKTINAGGEYVLYFHDAFPDFYRDIVRHPKRLRIQNVHQHVLWKKIGKHKYIPDFTYLEEK